MRQLDSSRFLWASLFGRHPALESSLREIADSGEWKAIPSLAPLLLDRSRSIGVTAAQTIARLLEGMDDADFVELETLCRHKWACDLVSTQQWNQMTPGDLGGFAVGECEVSVMGIASLHRNGWVREAAVRALDRLSGGLELPFLLLRVNDWVPAVREAAATGVLRRIRPEHGAVILKHLWLVLRLERCGRSRFHPIAAAVRDLLQKPGSIELLRCALHAPNSWVRREAFQLATTGESGAQSVILIEAAAAPDPVLRLWSARLLRTIPPDEDHHRTLQRLIRDCDAPVRCEAFLRLLEAYPQDALPAVTNGLMDRHASVRSLARHWMRTNATGTDCVQFYRKRLDAGAASQKRIAILGLSETGTAAECRELEGFLRGPENGLRRAAIRGLSVLDGQNYRESFLTAVLDDHPGVSREACRALAPMAPEIVDRVLPMLRVESRPHVRHNLLGLLLQQPFWQRGAFILESFGMDDPVLSTRVRQGFGVWLRKSGGVGIGPSRSEVLRLRAALNGSVALLTPKQVQEMEFILRVYS